MSTLYLHVGTPKTGTSAIQAFMAMEENRAVLESHGYSYPLFKEKYKMTGDDAVPQRNAHPLIYGMYLNKGKYDEYVSLRNNFYSDIKKLLDSGKNVVLSDESVWHNSLKIPEFYEEIKKRISSYGHELKIIVYLRRQDDFIQSYWRYKVMIPRRHLPLSFSQYIKSKKYEYFPLDYHKEISSIASVVGRENVIVRAYEREQYAGSPPSIIADFLECIGLTLTDEYQNPDIRRNLGIDYICCQIKRRINLDPDLQKNKAIRDYLIEITKENDDQGLYKVDTLFTKKGGEEFLSQYEESNRKVAQEFMNRPDGKLFYQIPQFEEKEVTRFSKEDYLNICFRLMKKMQARNEELEAQLRKKPEGTTMGKSTKHAFRKLFKG